MAHTTYGFESILKMIEYRFKPASPADIYRQPDKLLQSLATG